jgi:putative hemolysin
MIVDIFISLLSDKIYDKIKDWIDKRSISELIETLKQKTIEFEHKNDGTVIVSSQFANYIEYYNFLLKVMEHVLQPNISQVPKLTFVENMTDNIITYCGEKGYKLKVADKGLIKDFIEMIYTTVEGFAKDKINPEDKYLIYTVFWTS